MVREQIKKHLSNSTSSKYVKGMEKLSKLLGLDHQNAKVFSVLLGEIKVLEKRLDILENYIEKQTGLELGKELTDSSESSDLEEKIGIFSPTDCH
jgi:hypothetical protein